MKEAEEKISETEVMSLPVHLRKLGLIKRTAVGVKHVSSFSGFISEDGIRIQVEGPEKLKAKSQC